MSVFFKEWSFGKILFMFIVIGFLGVGSWGVSQSKVLLSKNQMTEITGGTGPSITLANLTQSWIPSYNATVKINATVSGSVSGGHVNFTLNPVTNYIGECMNSGTNTGYDLRLPSQQESTSGLTWSGGGGITLTATFGASPPSSFNVTVKCYDWGAFGMLNADLYDSSGILKDSDYTKIPRDDNGNEISDGWKYDWYWNYNESADGIWFGYNHENAPTGNTNDGDGFSIYEEYRGFKIKGSHTWLQPSKKDVFVYSEVDEGVGYASVSGHTFHLIYSYEYSNRVVNFNGQSVPGHSNQKGLYVREALGTGDYCGFTHPPAPATPNQVGTIDIYTNLIQAEYDYGNLGPYSVSDGTDAITGHEIGHGINLSHCPPGPPCLMKGGATVLQLIYYANYASHHNTQFKLK